VTLADRHDPAPVRETEVVFEGRVWDVRRDVVDLPTGPVVRDYVQHTGAVAIVVVDDADRVLLIRQYRHPIRTHEWELPAGLLDVPGEPPEVTASRELWEEADLRAERWWRLGEHHSSPGGLTERMHVFLARGLTVVPEDERHVRTDEEAGLKTRWVPLDEVADAILAGHLGNATLIVSVLMARELRSRGWAGLRPVESLD
jgi:ADP-ribose pyrophosphatase